MFYYFKFVYIVNILKLKLKLICMLPSVQTCTLYPVTLSVYSSLY